MVVQKELVDLEYLNDVDLLEVLLKMQYYSLLDSERVGSTVETAAVVVAVEQENYEVGLNCLERVNLAERTTVVKIDRNVVAAVGIDFVVD